MLAIIIPYYKLTFFEATLQSLADQTDKRFKVYIGDDASPEDCTALLQKFEGKFDFVYQRFETNLGGTSLTQQWERCISLSNQEEWLMVLGDDDVLGENVVEEFYKSLDFVLKNDCNLIRYATKIISDIGLDLSKIYIHPELELAADFFYRKMLKESRSSLSEYIFKRNTYNTIGFVDYPLAWHSDDRAWIDFAKDKPVYSINKALILIRTSSVNISGRNDNLYLKNTATILFLNDLILYKKNFNTLHRLKILLEYEIAIKEYRSLSIFEWRFLFRNYLINFRIKPFVKFIRRFSIAFFLKPKRN